MQLTKQLHILRALTAQIERVNPVNGYDYDLRGKVFRGRTLFGAETVRPCVAILEAPKPGQDIEADESKLVRNTDWLLLVQGWTTDDKENPLDPVYGLKAGVEQVLSRVAALRSDGGGPKYPDEYLFRVALGRSLVIAVKIGPGVCRPPIENNTAAFFYLPLTIEFMEDLEQPFIL